uniref:Uncharacterized protein n=1 Tax=Oryza brachyantha TaxID=4533 RepID=J3KV26_ORYBR
MTSARQRWHGYDDSDGDAHNNAGWGRGAGLTIDELELVVDYTIELALSATMQTQRGQTTASSLAGPEVGNKPNWRAPPIGVSRGRGRWGRLDREWLWGGLRPTRVGRERERVAVDWAAALGQPSVGEREGRHVGGGRGRVGQWPTLLGKKGRRKKEERKKGKERERKKKRRKGKEAKKEKKKTCLQFC